MKYSYIIIIIAVLVLAGLIGYLLFLRPKTAPSLGQEPVSVPEQQVVLAPLDPAAIPAGEKITLGTANGSVAVNNFYKVAQGYDGDALVVHMTPSYQIIYDGVDSAFGVYITGGTTASSRRTAEQDLISILGVPQAQICFLRASWSVSPRVDQNLAGRNYPLSFCPQTVQ